MDLSPSGCAVAAPANDDGEYTFTWDGVEFRVDEELRRKLAKGRTGAGLFDEIVRGYLAAMPMVAAALVEELGDPAELTQLGETPEAIAAFLGPVTVDAVSAKWGTRLSYVEHRLDEDHVLDVEITGVWESIDEVVLDG